MQIAESTVAVYILVRKGTASMSGHRCLFLLVSCWLETHSYLDSEDIAWSLA